MRKYFIHIILLSVLISCQHQEKKEGWSSYNTPYYQIEYPDNFEFVKKGQHNEAGDKMLQQAEFFLYLNDSISQLNNQFQANLNLLIQDLKGLNYTLDEFAQMSEEQVVKLIQDSEILESVPFSTYHKIKYKGKLDDRIIYFHQHYQLKNEKAFILTFSALKEDFTTYQPIIEKIFESFKVK